MDLDMEGIMTDFASAPVTDGPPLGQFAGHTDLGGVRHPGSAAYDPVDEQYLVAGASGPDDDCGHYLWQRLRGDFILLARLAVPLQGPQAPARVGWSARTSLAGGAPQVAAIRYGDGRAALAVRRVAGGPLEEVAAPIVGADVLQLERTGTRYRLAVARFGDPFVIVEAGEVELGADLYVGLFVGAAGDAEWAIARFQDVRITVPAAPDFVPYRDFLGSHLEILDIRDGRRQILYSAAVPFEAPNWPPDGAALIYNSGGQLYRFDLARRTPEMIDTGFARRNNNDHVLSFNGTMLGISHHSADDGGVSIIYTLPVGGGTPQRVTAQGPSYLHGWSPDGQFLVYTGIRNGQGDIYRIPVAGGAELRLTDTPGLDDGSEYTPDGQFIYFNSVRSGLMQIWRMRPDGSAPEQVTDDAFNNWFAHVSPDGRQIIFLSYTQEVAPGDHPPYKRVYLRLLPLAGGVPRVLAYVYGGQGTINVPPWSPDSTRVAFVSNSARL
jgi:hypothetical protein